LFMPLSDTEREITKTVVARFLDMGQATPRGVLVRQYRNLEALQRLTSWPILKKTGTGDESYLPLALAFHYSGDPDTVLRARTSVGIVLRVLQKIFEVEMEKKDFDPADVEAQAEKMFDLPPAGSLIRLGLYLAQEFGVFAGWSVTANQTGLQSFRIAERIIELTDFEKAWDDYIGRQTPYVENPEKFDGSLERRIPADLSDLETIAALASGTASSKPIEKDPKKGGRAKAFTSPFDDYTVVGQLGCGGSGTVFEVTDSAGNRWALKVIDATKASRTKLKRFQNEIQFCYRSSSKHIIRVFDFGKTDDGSLFYVMPLYPSTLRGRMSAGIPKSEVLPLYSQILDGVEAAHLLGVCHRDIKPENLLCDMETRSLVLADFGIARFKEEDLHTIVNTGGDERLANFAYAAPEQRFAGREVDHRADIYALGLLLNEMFTGSIPQGTGFRRIASVAPEFGYLDELVDLMIQQQPDRRPGSVSKVKEELIGRGHQFVELQRLDEAKKQVVPVSEINDPLISDPIRLVDKEDYSQNILTLRLNRPVNDVWVACFRKRATRFSANMSSAMVSFSGDSVKIRVTEHFLNDGVSFVKDYIPAANEEYAAHIKREHQKELDRQRAAQKSRIAQQEARIRALQKVQI
jgi:eukaryotic-like serine/threonine-protein kinase